jgi:type I restriction enzyme, S subunit
MSKAGKPGYWETAVGWIPTEWQVRLIGDMTEVSTGGTPTTSNERYWNPPEVPWMSSGEVHLRRVYSTEKKISKLGLRNSAAKVFPKKSVVMALAGQGKTRGSVAVLEAEVATNQSLAAIYPSDFFTTDYLFYNLEWRYKELRSLSSGEGGRGGLNLSIIKSIPLALPSLQEQQKIAAILTTMDHKLNVIARLVATTQKLKQGLMQILFSRGVGVQDADGRWVPHTEFKDCEAGKIPKSWLITTLGDVCAGALQTGPFGSQLHAGEYQHEGVPLLMPKDLVNWRANLSTAARIAPSRAAELAKHTAVEGDLLFSRRGDVGRFALIDKASEGALCGTGCLKAKPSNAHSSIFLAHLLQRDVVQAWLEQNAVGQTMPNMNTKILSSLPLVVPATKKEQEEIAEILNSVDAKVKLFSERQIHYQILKRTMMQKLLTGEWRVKLDTPSEKKVA